MRTQPNPDLIRRALRVKVCASCPRRPAGSETWGGDSPRPCEGACPIFVHLPLLAKAAAQVDPLVGSRQRVLRGLMRRLDEPDSREATASAKRARPSVARTLGRRVVRVIDGLMPA